MLGGRPIDEWVAQYEQSHQHPINRTCHTIGIPLIAGSVLLFLAAPFARGLWRVALGLFVRKCSLLPYLQLMLHLAV